MLHCLVQNWHKAQLVYTPHVASLISQMPSADTTDATSPDFLPKKIPLFLPSLLPPHIHTLPKPQEICGLERHLREPEADDALVEVQHQHCVIQGLWKIKRLNVSGTGNRPNT